MIGKVIVGGSFYETIRYVLEDKRNLSEAEIKNSIRDGIQFQDRAEVLLYNKCSGNAARLAAQFLEVKNLNKRVEKPVFHFFLRLAPGDVMDRRKLIEMGEACVKEFGVADNQYIMVLHKDSKEPHIHIVANRVGYDGKLAKDFQNYKKMDAFCRRIEKEFHLKQVLSAKRYLPEELRHLPRYNARFEKLKKDIQQTLGKVSTYHQFEERMKVLGYAVLKGRGICFIDEKKVRIKGSEVGFSLARIEQILAYKQKIAQKQDMMNVKQKLHSIADANKFPLEKQHPHLRPNSDLARAARILQQISGKENWDEKKKVQEEINSMKNTVWGLIYDLMKPVPVEQDIAPELLKEAKKKKKRLRHRQ